MLFLETEQEIKENREDKAMYYYEKEFQSTVDLEEEKHTHLFIAGVNLNSELLIDKAPNNNNDHCENESDETRMDFELSGKAYEDYISMVSSTRDDGIKSEIMNVKSEK